MKTPIELEIAIRSAILAAYAAQNPPEPSYVKTVGYDDNDKAILEYGPTRPAQPDFKLVKAIATGIANVIAPLLP